MPGAHGARPAGARLDHDLRLQALAVIAGACLVQALPSLLPLAWFVPALGICLLRFPGRTLFAAMLLTAAWTTILAGQHMAARLDRKSTRLNSSHVSISYAVFCVK